MKQEDTKNKILDKALELFATKGYEAVSVGEIAKAVGIKAPSLYNHYASKQAIFDGIVESVSERYEQGTDKIDVHVDRAETDVGGYFGVSEDDIVKRLRDIFLYSLRDEKVKLFRKMMTIEQFRSAEIAAMYSKRYVERLVAYHALFFRKLTEAGELRAAPSEPLALMFVAPVITLLGICDRQPEREEECLKKLDEHARLFYRSFNLTAVDKI